MGACSTHPSLCAETGVDALRLLFRAHRLPARIFDVDGWKVGPVPSHGLVFAERKGGAAGLWSPERLVDLGQDAWRIVDDHFGWYGDVGVSRIDLTTTRRFASPSHGRAFMAGMAAMEFPRLEATRRGSPPHSVAWTGERSRKIRNRCYDKGHEQGGERWLSIRLEDQRSLPAGRRPTLEQAADPEWQREHFVGRFGPMRKAVTGVKAAGLPVVLKSLADEFRYGYRDRGEFERLAGTVVAIAGGAVDAYARSTGYKRVAELREAGYVTVEDFMDTVEVDLGDELDRALEEFGG
jgi:hypothetical protein